jgi:PAS domain S-box-containing protein
MTTEIQVLLLEDDPITVRLIKKFRHPGALFCITDMHTRDSFVSALQSRTFDCLVLDYMLPDMNGLEALEIAKELAPTVPALIYTGSVGEEKVVECMKAGAVDFILKSQPQHLKAAMLSSLTIKRALEEKIKADEALRISEQRYHTLSDMSPVGIFRTDTEGRTVYVNPRWTEISGLKESEALGNGWLSVVHPDDLKAVTAGWGTAVQKQSLSIQEYRFLRHDGKIEWVLGHSVPEYDGKGNISGYVGTITDITALKETELNLRESERKYKTLVESTNVGIFQAGLDGKFIHVNSAFIKMSGYDNLSEFSDVQVKRFFDADPANRSVIQDLMTNGHVSNIEIFSYRKDGSQYWISLSAVLLREQDGTPSSILGSVLDISERKKMEDQIKESETYYRILIETSPDAIAIMDTQGNIVFGSKKAREIYNFPNDIHMLGLSFVKIVAPEDRAAAEAQMRGILSGTVQPATKEYRLLRYDKTPFWGEVTATALKDAKGTITGILTICRDVTERKQVEETLRLSEKRYRDLYDNATIGIYRTTPNGKILFANPHMVKMLGYASFEELERRNLEEFGYEPSYKRQKFKNLIEREKIVRGHEAIWIKKDRTEIHVRENASVGYNPDGTIAYYDGTAEDITEQTKLREQLIQSQKMEAVGQLAGGVAHDYNNMIGVILGYGSLLEKEVASSESASRKVKAILTAANRSANLTKQLLAFARKQVITPTVLNINEELTSLNKMLGRLIGEQIDLTLTLEAKLWNVKMDPTQIDQIVTNLCANARDATANIGTITISTTNCHVDRMPQKAHKDLPPGEYAVLAVSDTGSGMNAATLKHIYEPFFTTKPVGQGTGLGLATVFGIVKQNNGFIEVRSAVGKGSTFNIYFPRFYGEIKTESEETKEEALQGTGSILIVEDEEDLLNFIEAALKIYGYTVRSTKSPKAALQICSDKTEAFDLLITDVIMPDMNGKELTEHIKAIQPSLHVLYISGYTADIVAQRGILDQETNFLQKPFTTKALAEKIHSILCAK